jgi:hypothetical protein
MFELNILDKPPKVLLNEASEAPNATAFENV